MMPYGCVGGSSSSCSALIAAILLYYTEGIMSRVGTDNSWCLARPQLALIASSTNLIVVDEHGGQPHLAHLVKLP